jgi:hypothetical protein
MLSVVFLAVGAFVSSPAFGQSPNPSSGKPNSSVMPTYIEEFFLSEAVRNQDKGDLQMTFGVDSRDHLGSNAVLQLEYGLTDRLQVSSEVPYGITAEHYAEVPEGWSSATVGVQYQLVQRRTFTLTAGMGVSFPFNSKSESSWEPSMLVARSFGRLQLHGSVIGEFENGSKSFAYNIASVYPVRRHWFPTLEWNGRRLLGRNAFYATPGVYRHYGRGLEIGVGVPVGIGGVASSGGIVVKITWEFKEDRDRD